MAGRDVDLTNKEEVKEYLENLGIEYRFGCYHEKTPKACQLLGEYMEGITRDFKTALKIYVKNCDENNFPHSCFKVGSYKAIGRETERDMDEAYSYFVKGCELGDVKSCYTAGYMDSIPAGEDVPLSAGENKIPRKGIPDLKRGLEFYRKACELEHHDGCYRYGHSLATGVPGILEKDVAKALKMFGRGCEFGSFESCVNAAYLHKHGDEGVPKNENLANEFMAYAKDLKRQEEIRERVRFQEGAETAGN